ncbi:MFS transporter [Actinomadura sp. NBRC 104425]|uniref:MFS transporter n=1 Tax=Actinomadura sp. NBRC 104425 TaxID=3032204 RepID=UPI0024A28BBE|nr:MFS transporter [Actinomadura sp. NBRC 104425]GLZ15119.1 MFS transporter [Actinomadura sp. NBRC 104425]
MLFRSRLGSFLTFALAGMLCGVWTARMPALADEFRAGESGVGIVVLVWGLGALAAMQGLRGVMARTGSRGVLRVALPLTALTYALVALAPSYGVLLAAVALFGMAFGVTDIAMNAQASAVEQTYRRPIMSGMHAGWCVGAMSGGLFGVLTAALGLGFTPTVLAAGLPALPAALALGRTYLPDPAAPADGDGGGDGAGRRRAGLPAAVYVIGVLAFVAFMAEGSIADWSGLLLHREMGASQALAAAGYPLFELAMLLGRLFGDRVRVRLGTRRMLAAAGVGTSLSMAVVVLAPGAPVAVAGFFLAGLAVCTVVPTMMSLAGTAAPGRSGAAVAQVGAMGYGGLLLGPVVVGFLSEATSLRVGVGVVVVLALLVSAGVRFVPLGGDADVAASDTAGAGAQEPAATLAA